MTECFLFMLTWLYCHVFFDMFLTRSKTDMFSRYLVCQEFGPCIMFPRYLVSLSYCIIASIDGCLDMWYGGQHLALYEFQTSETIWNVMLLLDPIKNCPLCHNLFGSLILTLWNTIVRFQCKCCLVLIDMTILSRCLDISFDEILDWHVSLLYIMVVSCTIMLSNLWFLWYVVW